jgi:hypothetical protein
MNVILPKKHDVMMMMMMMMRNWILVAGIGRQAEIASDIGTPAARMTSPRGLCSPRGLRSDHRGAAGGRGLETYFYQNFFPNIIMSSLL